MLWLRVTLNYHEMYFLLLYINFRFLIIRIVFWVLIINFCLSQFDTKIILQFVSNISLCPNLFVIFDFLWLN